MAPDSPDFGKADLSNCERELIHLAGSIQPHGVLLVIAPDGKQILQVSSNTADYLGLQPEQLLGRPLALLGQQFEGELPELQATLSQEHPRLLRYRITVNKVEKSFDGILHKLQSGALILELEPAGVEPSSAVNSAAPASDFSQTITAATRRFSEAITITGLADEVVQVFRNLTGFDRVMVYRFDSDGHGEIIAEARTESLESLLGHHYPASDIPQRARELYLRNRVRILVDVNYLPVPIHPRAYPLTGAELDMSLCGLRSMSPLHIQYLKNMGVTATLVVSLVREGHLWGLIACHHYAARYVPLTLRLCSDLLAEVISTRIAAIENYAHTQIAIMVRRLEQRLIEATSAEGDWRYALLRNPQRNLLQPLTASGAALFFDNEILTAGDVPSTPELRELGSWIVNRTTESIFSCNSIGKENPKLASLAAVASGVLAVELSATRPDFLLWFRKEQLSTVTWAGDPSKPVAMDNPLELSPRRSFAAWSEIVQGSAKPWSSSDIALARAIGEALVDIILQVQAVRLLIAQHQMLEEQKQIQNSKEPVLLLNATGSVIFYNKVFRRIFALTAPELATIDDIAALFTDPNRARAILTSLVHQQRPWRGELAAATPLGGLPLAVRADIIPGTAATPLGFILLFTELANTKKAEQARRHLETVLHVGDDQGLGDMQTPPLKPDAAIHAIIANATMAAMDITDGAHSGKLAEIIEEVETSAQRAARLYQRLQAFLAPE